MTIETNSPEETFALGQKLGDRQKQDKSIP